jgi:hypothetical protein
MKEIYLTQESKQEIEAKIVELEKPLNKQPAHIDTIHYKLIDAYKEILSSAIILPVEESWYDVKQSVVLENVYPQGVIIQPKQ